MALPELLLSTPWIKIADKFDQKSFFASIEAKLKRSTLNSASFQRLIWNEIIYDKNNFKKTNARTIMIMSD